MLFPVGGNVVLHLSEFFPQQHLVEQPTVKAKRVCVEDFYASLSLEGVQVLRRKNAGWKIANFTATKEISLPECVSLSVRATTDFHYELDSYQRQNRAGRCEKS